MKGRPRLATINALAEERKKHGKTADSQCCDQTRSQFGELELNRFAIRRQNKIAHGCCLNGSQSRVDVPLAAWFQRVHSFHSRGKITDHILGKHSFFSRRSARLQKARGRCPVRPASISHIVKQRSRSGLGLPRSDAVRRCETEQRNRQIIDNGLITVPRPTNRTKQCPWLSNLRFASISSSGLY